MVKAINDIHLSGNLIQPDLHGQAFGVLGGNEVDGPERQEEGSYQQ